jgi:hypothetical protein
MKMNVRRFFVGLLLVDMDPYLLIFIFSGLCLTSAFGMSVCILAASILSSRISKSEGIDELQPPGRSIAPDPLSSPLTDSP